MARIASKAKAGFYPTPEAVLKVIKNKLILCDDARLLDPCCGEAEALFEIAESKGHTYGIELELNRAEIAKKRLKKVIWADALKEAYVMQNGFGLLFLNPPYDFHNHDRVENLFLKKYIKTLQQNGILIFIVPYNTLHYYADTFTKHFRERELKVFAFPKKKFRQFKQCVVIGRKEFVPISERIKPKERLAYWKRISSMLPEQFIEATPEISEKTLQNLTVPSPANELSLFRSSKINPYQYLPLVNKVGLLKNIIKQITPKDKNIISPLTPLKNGHLSLMLAGGYMNGSIAKGDKRLVIKGIVKQGEDINVTGGKKKTITTIRSKYATTIRAIDLKEGIIFNIE